MPLASMLAHAYGPEGGAYLMIDAATFLISGALALAFLFLPDKPARAVYIVAIAALLLVHARALMTGTWWWTTLMLGWVEIFTTSGHVDSSLALILAIPPITTLFVFLAPFCRIQIRRAQHSAV